LAYAFDATIGAAGAALTLPAALPILDNFFLDTLVPMAAPSLPFSDDFTQQDGSQLTRGWTERQGNFKVVGNALVANDPSINTATDREGVVSGVGVQADVVGGFRQEVG